MTKNQIHRFVFIVTLLMLQSSFATANELTVSRTFYPDLDFIELKQLKDNFYNYLVIDVRTKYEYDLMHIEDAISIPSIEADFLERLRSVRRMNKLNVVLYSNGGISKKAHNAARLAVRKRMQNIAVLDAGINQWEKAYPEITEFGGISVAGVADRLSTEEVSQHTLDIKNFNQELSRLDGILVDIRDDQKSNSPMDVNSVKAPLDSEKKLAKIIDHSKASQRPLFFYDSVGIQYQWLIYKLKQAGLKNFYFLKGGSQRAGGISSELSLSRN